MNAPDQPFSPEMAESPTVTERYAGDYPIVIEGLSNRFGSHVVHEDLCLKVRHGEILGVVGGSGSGKSVLMRSIIGLQRPAEGQVEVFGQSMMGAGPNDHIDVRSRWGVLFQGGALFSTLTVAENVEVPLKQFYPQISAELRREIAHYKVRLSGLPEDAANKYPSELSGGMKKRAGLARALALDPELLFLDEPTAGLDPIGAAGFDRLTRDLANTLGLTVFLITHDLDTLFEICDRVAVLAERRVVAIGTISELLATDHAWIQEYFNGPRGRAARQTAERHRATLQERSADAAEAGAEMAGAETASTGAIEAETVDKPGDSGK